MHFARRWARAHRHSSLLRLTTRTTCGSSSTTAPSPSSSASLRRPTPTSETSIRPCGASATSPATTQAQRQLPRPRPHLCYRLHFFSTLHRPCNFRLIPTHHPEVARVMSTLLGCKLPSELLALWNQEQHSYGWVSRTHPHASAPPPHTYAHPNHPGRAAQPTTSHVSTRNILERLALLTGTTYHCTHASPAPLPHTGNGDSHHEATGKAEGEV